MGPPSTSSSIDSTWPAPVHHLNYDMLQTAPPSWSYMDNTFAPSSHYLGGHHHHHHQQQQQQPPPQQHHHSHHSQQYQNPYVPTWAAQTSPYNTTTGSTQSMYTSQMMTTQSMMPPSLSTEADSKGYATSMPEASPSTSTTSISSLVAAWTPLPPGHSDHNAELPHVCPFRGCGRAYKRKAELDRHTQEKHGPTSGRLLCPVKMCPRGIPGEGFDRMSHLTQHLRSGKHKMTPQQAKFMAREHNPRKGGKNV